MTDERLACCIWLLIRRAQSGDVCAGALLADYARLKVLAREPLDALLKHYAPTGYEQPQSFEIIRESCPTYGPDDRADPLEEA